MCKTGRAKAAQGTAAYHTAAPPTEQQPTPATHAAPPPTVEADDVMEKATAWRGRRAEVGGKTWTRRKKKKTRRVPEILYKFLGFWLYTSKQGIFL